MIGYGDRLKAINCKAENISVTGASNSGGFIGLAGGSAFENCKASGTVSGTWALGGFVGYSYSSMLDGTEPSVYTKCAAMWTLKALTGDWADLPVLQRAENLTTVLLSGMLPARSMDGTESRRIYRGERRRYCN